MYARSLGKEKLLALLAAQEAVAGLMTAEEALAAAEDEGLQLVRATSASGYAHVSYANGQVSQLASAEKMKRTKLYRVTAGNFTG